MKLEFFSYNIDDPRVTKGESIEECTIIFHEIWNYVDDKLVLVGTKDNDKWNHYWKVDTVNNLKNNLGSRLVDIEIKDDCLIYKVKFIKTYIELASLEDMIDFVEKHGDIVVTKNGIELYEES